MNDQDLTPDELAKLNETVPENRYRHCRHCGRRSVDQFPQGHVRACYMPGCDGAKMGAP